MAMQTVLVTGAGRGLGLEFVRQYLQDGWRVLATRRAENDELTRLAEQFPDRLRQITLDVTDWDALARLPDVLADERIALLINNAGIYGGIHQQLNDCDIDSFQRVLAVNTLAPLKLTAAVRPLLQNQAKIAFITSLMGSMADNGSGGDYAYRASKAALNAVGKSMAVDLEGKHPVVLLHPGWVRTDMGGDAALIDVRTSVSGMRAVIDGFQAWNTGRFYKYDGSELPW